jgi:hypothetical protein
MLERGQYLTKEELDEAYILLLKTREPEKMKEEEWRRACYLLPMVQSATDFVRRNWAGEFKTQYYERFSSI